MALNPKQKRFVAAYAGNASEAAKAAGYSEKTAASQGQRLLKHVEVQAAIQSREDRSTERLTTTREERQKFWAGVMRDDDQAMQLRLKASEYAAKADGDFLERKQEVSGMTWEEWLAMTQGKDAE